MAKGKLAKASASPVAAKIRKAIGATPTEEVQYTTPQFKRPIDVKIGPAPRTSAEWAQLAKRTPAELIDLGLRRWDVDSKSGRMLWLFPGEWYASIPSGLKIVNIFFDELSFDSSSIGNGIRMGCLSYGILGPV